MSADTRVAVVSLLKYMVGAQVKSTVRKGSVQGCGFGILEPLRKTLRAAELLAIIFHLLSTLVSNDRRPRADGSEYHSVATEARGSPL